ncbi:hypothetical protein KCP70_07310 [Salmonella enterica subsp. enterica]|nr:hypothetical protein KCP70_07310 [Salmonella enterica subsp. enterica]
MGGAYDVAEDTDWAPVLRVDGSAATITLTLQRSAGCIMAWLWQECG